MNASHITERGRLTAGDGTALYYEIDRPPQARGRALLIHGFLDHSGRYQSVVEALCALGFDCLRFDCRGHGRSGGARGHVDRFERYLDDLQAVVEGPWTQLTRGPSFLVSHSHGGLIALAALGNALLEVDGAAFSSPFFGFGKPVPRLKGAAGHLLSRVAPSLALGAVVDPEDCTHDPEVIARTRRDPLVGRVATGRWLTEAIRMHRQAHELAQRIAETPVLFQQAGADVVASPQAARAVFDALMTHQRRFELYPDLRHEIWFELDRAQPMSDLTGWLSSLCGEDADPS